MWFISPNKVFGVRWEQQHEQQPESEGLLRDIQINQHHRSGFEFGLSLLFYGSRISSNSGINLIQIPRTQCFLSLHFVVFNTRMKWDFKKKKARTFHSVVFVCGFLDRSQTRINPINIWCKMEMLLLTSWYISLTFLLSYQGIKHQSWLEKSSVFRWVRTIWCAST